MWDKPQLKLFLLPVKAISSCVVKFVSITQMNSVLNRELDQSDANTFSISRFPASMT